MATRPEVGSKVRRACMDCGVLAGGEVAFRKSRMPICDPCATKREARRKKLILAGSKYFDPAQVAAADRERARERAEQRLKFEEERRQETYRKKLEAEEREKLKQEQQAAALLRAKQEELNAAARELAARELAARELAARELARRNLLAFVMRTYPAYQPGWVHREICAKLEQFLQDVVDGKSPRLMLQLPPRHGKSALASQFFPAWALGRHPEFEVISASYAAELQLDFSRKVRAMLRDDGYQVLFPDTRLDPDNQNAQRWLTTAGGGFLPAGVGGPLTGRGAHILIIDDPVKNAEEAFSETTRNAVWDWYATTAYTRLAPGGGVLVIQTRWHEDDLSGRLETAMRESDGDEFEIIRYPAVADEDEAHRAAGEALHPARFPLNALQRIQRAVGPSVWASLYQQRPAGKDGSYFTSAMIHRYDELPKGLRYYAAWDLAIGQKERNDWTVGVVVGLDRKDNLYLVDVIRGRWDSLEIVERIIDVHLQYNTAANGIEKGQIQMAIGPLLQKRIRERKAYGLYAPELPPGRRDKETRARPLQGRMRQGKVLFPRVAAWMPDLLAELLSFPFGKHDDQVDALAWIAQMLGGMVALTVPVEDKRPEWMKKLVGKLAAARGSGHMAA